MSAYIAQVSSSSQLKQLSTRVINGEEFIMPVSQIRTPTKLSSGYGENRRYARRQQIKSGGGGANSPTSITRHACNELIFD